MAGLNFFYTFFITLFHTPFPLSFILFTTLSICGYGKAVAIAAKVPRIADKHNAQRRVWDAKRRVIDAHRLALAATRSRGRNRRDGTGGIRCRRVAR